MTAELFGHAIPVAVVVVGAAILALPTGWLSWRVAEHYIEARPLEEGDTEFRLPPTTAIGLNVAVYALFAWRYADQLGVLAFLLGCYVFLHALLLVDFGRYYLPNRLIAATILFGVPAVTVLDLVTDRPGLVYAYAGIAVNFGLYFLFWFVGQILFGSKGLGFGDVKLAAALGLVIGAFVGTPRDLVILLFWGLLIGFLAGGLSSLVLLRATSGSRRRQAFPLGPFLVLGSVVVVSFPLRFLYS